MKYFTFISLSVFFNLVAVAQDPDFDVHNWKPPYFLELPKDWGAEKFALPPGFAPAIRYHGVEDIRFAPGWGKSGHENYWTYAFLWFTDTNITLNVTVLEKDLAAYYTGLLLVNSDVDRYNSETPVPVKVQMTEKEGGLFEGSVYMRDYMSRKPITLQCKVTSRFCKETNKSIIFFRLSPQPFTHAAWKLLDDLWKNFSCIE